MPVINETTGTRVDEIAPGIHRISTPVPPSIVPGGFTFNQFLLADEQPVLMHTGPRQLFEVTRAAVASVIDPSTIRWIAISHVEADECGALDGWLAAAPRAQPLCSTVAAMVSVADLSTRPPVPMADAELRSIGRMRLQWFDTPHLPHGLDTGYIFEQTTRTLLCGDLFAQGGAEVPPSTPAAEEIWERSESFRAAFPYAPITNARSMLDTLAATDPAVLACMHGSTLVGGGGELLRRLADALDPR